MSLCAESILCLPATPAYHSEPLANHSVASAAALLCKPTSTDVLLLQVMLYLLNKGAIVDLSDINDFTCLHAAAATGNLDIVNLLIENSGHSLVSDHLAF